MAEPNHDESAATYEDLIALEQDFEDVELDIIRRQHHLSAPIYARRAATISKIPNFWALVLEQSPPEVDQYIQPSDSKLFAECLTSISLSRFEIDDDEGNSGGGGSGGSPRSFSIRFEFAADKNEWFENEVLEKKFWYRRGRDGSVGLVSEPVRIRWRKGRDLTNGLGEAACRLWEARRKTGLLADGASAGKLQGLQEYRALAKKLKNETEGSPSFFLLFGFVSSTRWISEEESREANAVEAKRKEQRKKGDKLEPLPEEIEVEDETEVEVCPHGEDLANVIAEDVWPGAIKYFTSAQEMDDDALSEADFEDDDEDDEDEQIDIRSLVQGKRKEKASNGSASPVEPPTKSRKR